VKLVPKPGPGAHRMQNHLSRGSTTMSPQNTRNGTMGSGLWQQLTFCDVQSVKEGRREGLIMHDDRDQAHRAVAVRRGRCVHLLPTPLVPTHARRDIPVVQMPLIIPYANQTSVCLDIPTATSKHSFGSFFTVQSSRTATAG
jgi:hypothetical protein